MNKHQAQQPPRQTPRKISWSDPGIRSVIYQAIAIILVFATAWFLVTNTLHNLAARNIATGFAFLDKPAGFAIGEALIEYTPTDTYRHAIYVGILNTLLVAAVGIVFATIVGTVVGIMRLSKNWLINRVAAAYVEVIRNIPLLIQLFVWYAIISENMPGPKEAFEPLHGVFISNRGIKIPALGGDSFHWILISILLVIALMLPITRWAKVRQQRTGKPLPLFTISCALFVFAPFAAWSMSGMDMNVSFPEKSGFGFDGGWTLSPEMFALLAGLISYTAAFIAEIVRSGIQAVNLGQWEAADSIGLGRMRVLQLVILPQALRVVIPPATSQYLNLVKNSSLAVAIGYPDMVSVVNTTLNQTGQAIEGILIIMGAYMTVSLSISLLMNWYNRRIAIVGR